MHTKDKLAQALRESGLDEMADKAATGYFDDYLSPLDLPELTLMSMLGNIGSPAAMAIRDRVMNGEFEATMEEGDAWAASQEGQEAFRKLLR